MQGVQDVLPVVVVHSHEYCIVHDVRGLLYVDMCHIYIFFVWQKVSTLLVPISFRVNSMVACTLHFFLLIYYYNNNV